MLAGHVNLEGLPESGEAKLRPPGQRLHVLDPERSARVPAVRRAPHIRAPLGNHPGNLAGAGVVRAVDKLPALGQTLEIGNEGVADIRVVAVVVEMVRLDARDDDDVGVKIEEVAPVLTGLGDEELLPAGVGGHSVEVGGRTAHEHRTGKAETLHEAADHGGRRGLPVHPGDPQGGTPARKLSERLGIGEAGNPPIAGRGELGIAFGVVGGGVDNDAGIRGKRLRLEADTDGNAETLEDGVGVEDFRRVRAGDPGARTMEHLGQRGHAGALDADHERRHVLELRGESMGTHGPHPIQCRVIIQRGRADLLPRPTEGSRR